jgi:hypothetical protein
MEGPVLRLLISFRSVKKSPPYKKGCTLLAAASDQVYQLLAHGRCTWFSSDTPASSTNKTGRHDDIAEILLKVALKHQKSNQINQISINLAKWF